MKIVTYNTFQEKNGHDPAIDALLQSDAIVCLQEVRPRRALEIKCTLGSRAFISPAKSSLLCLAIVLPEGWCFLKRQTKGLNGYKGCIPAPWSLRCSYRRLTGRMPGWTDGLETRVVQIAFVANLRTDRVIRVLNTHLPFVPELRNRCLAILNGLVGRFAGDVIFAGDFNAINSRYFAHCILGTGLRLTGVSSREPTHDSGRKIDRIMYRGDFREVGYSVWRGDGLSDHRIVTVELETKPGERT